MTFLLLFGAFLLLMCLGDLASMALCKSAGRADLVRELWEAGEEGQG